MTPRIIQMASTWFIRGAPASLWGPLCIYNTFHLACHRNLFLNTLHIWSVPQALKNSLQGQVSAFHTAQQGGSVITFSWCSLKMPGQPMGETRKACACWDRGEQKRRNPIIQGAPEPLPTQVSTCTFELSSSAGLLPVRLCPPDLQNFSNAPDFLAGLTALWRG